ncbi:ATP-binding protein [Demequina capsici]|uniref:Sensor-like histidine kinase SenX3 n=1 Tax=Demequina capsici TaxID=3075620 RepID=A0AA96FDB6_9MICO|nr:MULTISPECIES: ATP-binding protein [unclassified Demequina]WNM24941.1 ATP-binding protein [Demequina sp. OYTSA14]WNM27848.1 ATP-binding protein [Demequina sp. PMTSA13]
MDGVEVLWIVLAFAAGSGVGALLLRRRHRREVIARTLVPHRTREVLAAMQSGAVIVRRDRRAAFANGPAAALAVARLDGKLQPEVADLAEEAWDRDEPVEREVEIRRGVLGAVTHVHVRVTPLGDELAFAVANDNTEMRAVEQARREFATNVSHELKTPVGALSLLAETIEEGADDPEMVRQFARKIRKESRRLTKLIQEIIEISRLQGDDTVRDHQPVHLTEVVAEAIDGARLGAEQRRIEVSSSVSAEPVTMGDRDLLVMAVRNLVDNAVAYSEEGGKVTVALAEDDGVAAISVIDHGIGIDQKDQERIFERFYRTDPARSRQTGGTGLGLSIVKHVALQHAGTVEVWSQPNVGSTFTLRLQAQEEGMTE